jgi:hypothetical protein
VVIDRPTFERMAEPNPHINAAIGAARRAAPGWTTSAAESLQRAARTPWGQSMLAPNPGYASLLAELQGKPSDSVRVALIRQMEGLHTFSHIINRTRRRDIGEFTVRQPRTEAIEFTLRQQQLHDEVLRVQERLLRLRHGDIPVAFLMSTIRRQLASCVHGLAPLLEEVMQRGLAALELPDADLADGAPELIESIRTEISALATMARELPAEDPKVERLLSIASEKAALPNHRLLLFSTFRHTLAYLEWKLGATGRRVGLVHGGIDNDERRSLRRRFALPQADAEAIDVFLSSEIGSEGLDFQFCDALVNYDIPWNPMRIEQRIGRIDRYGQKSESVAIWNLVTPGTVDFEVYERCLLRIGVFMQSIGGCEEILGGIAREIRSVAEDMTLSPAERQSRLQQLAENDIRLLHEQDELEKRQTELFGIRPAVRGGEDDIAETLWLAPPALEHLVRAYLLQLLPDRESLLGAGSLKTLRLAADARRVLLDRAGPKRALPSLTDRQWLAWLKGSEPTLSVTFDRDTARDNPAAVLITPVHPLVRLAAESYGGNTPVNVSLRVGSASVPAGSYPFAIYQWRFTGIKPDAQLVSVTSCPVDQLGFLSMIAAARETPEDHTMDLQTSELEALHHRLWSDARAKHRDDTAATAAFRRESFLASHDARIATLRELESAASDARIRKMRTAQIAAAEAETEHRLAELGKASAEAEILFRPVA